MSCPELIEIVVDKRISVCKVTAPTNSTGARVLHEVSYLMVYVACPVLVLGITVKGIAGSIIKEPECFECARTAFGFSSWSMEHLLGFVKREYL